MFWTQKQITTPAKVTHIHLELTHFIEEEEDDKEEQNDEEYEDNVEPGYEGDLDIECPNPVYYWVKFLKSEVDIDLSNIQSQDQLDQIVSNYLKTNHNLIRPNLNADSLSRRLAMESVHAGYPIGLFSFHSLRAGFLCTAVVNGIRRG